MTDGIMKKMTFIVYSHVSEEELSDSLGMPEYSYYFVLRGFLPVLRELGQVVVVKNPEQEVDAIYDDCRKRGEDCVFLTFSPPNKSAVGLRCPTICVLAWEFDPIPDEVWDNDPKNDWRFVLSDHGCMISLSQYTADSVKRMMGENFSVATIPSPVWDAFADFRDNAGDMVSISPSDILIKGNVVDSRNYYIAPDAFELLNPYGSFQFRDWSGETLHLGFTRGDEFSAYLGGFYKSETWGTWSRISKPWIFLPYKLSGVVRFKITACGYGKNYDKDIFVALGDEKKQVRLKDLNESIDVKFQIDYPDNVLRFSGLDLSPVPNATDPRSMAIGLQTMEISSINKLPDWTGETLNMGFTQTDEIVASLAGFYKPEPWGAWSCNEEPEVLLPYRLKGVVHLKISACGYGKNCDKDIFVALGDEKKQVRLKDFSEDIHVSFQLNRPASVLKFSGLDLSPVPNAVDLRSMGIGLRSIEISGYPCKENEKVTEQANESVRKVVLDGVVYTSVFSPLDGRKNWQDIVTAFCTAFQDVEDATLVLKMSHHSLSSFLGKLHFFLQQLSPFKCRIVALHGYMDSDEYEKLIAATHFYVNASRCEGLCLPLMEYMACRKPAIAPCHTAMADYVDSSSTFIVDSSLEPCMWPHDSRDVFRAMRYRIDWESLVGAYRQSYDIAKNQPAVYREMAKAASSQIQKVASNNIVKEKLHKFLTKELGCRF